ncbi:AraC family transcriptional regulator [Listeria grayi FSL F6-1183]|uniref:AraC family transcriptional regulator n=3 Tax=Listeria grayi TaxID=1641 RepID=A0A829R428_LISGR|nr:AraC family transcriptional regulator [Listeria grayi FSL F6-1183]
MDPKIKEQLFRLNPHEIAQKETGTFIMDYPKKSFSEENGEINMLNRYFF